MKFTISSSVLSARLQAAGRVIASKNNLPILDCFLFDIQGNRLTLTASDNETTLTTWVDLVESDADIRFAVNAKTIQDAMKEIPDQPLEFYVSVPSLEITIEYQNGKYNFMGQPADEYPVPPRMEEDTVTLNLDDTILLNGLGRALFATADDTLRPVMTGVFFDVAEDSLAIVASDGHKLACSRLMNTKTTRPGNFILPKKPAQLLKNVLVKESGEASIEFGQRNAVISTGTYVLNCRLIEGHYPNYNSVIPSDNPNCVTINRTALLGTLRRVLIFSNAYSALVKLRLEASRMVISSQDIDFSMSAEESLLCDYSGVPMSIGFKGTYLMELLNNLEGEEVVIKLADASRAGVIVPAVQPEGETVQMLLMPMVLNE